MARRWWPVDLWRGCDRSRNFGRPIRRAIGARVEGMQQGAAMTVVRSRSTSPKVGRSETILKIIQCY